MKNVAASFPARQRAGSMVGVACAPLRSCPRTTPALPAGHASVAQCPTPPHGLHRCAHCHRWLPLSEFYIRPADGQPDSYCKDCRRTAARLRRKAAATACTKPDAPARLLIMQTADPALRLTLILRAKQTVRDSMARKRTRLKEREWEEEGA